MASREIVLQVSEKFYQELVQAQQNLNYPSISDLVMQAVQRRLAELERESWQQELRDLQRDVRGTGIGLGESKEEVIAKLREARNQIFEQEYAHLY